LRRIVGEDHAAICRERLAEHEAPLLLFRGGRNLDREPVRCVAASNGQRYFAQSRLRSIDSGGRITRGVVRRGRGSACDERG